MIYKFNKGVSMVLPKSILTTIRMDEYTKSVVDRAASLANVSRTSFILSVVRERAEQVIQERKSVMREVAPLALNAPDSKAFLDALENDFTPPSSLLNLNTLRHKDIVDRT
jgi:uncharacterized protein (DUF1778 family)